MKRKLVVTRGQAGGNSWNGVMGAHLDGRAMGSWGEQPEGLCNGNSWMREPSAGGGHGRVTFMGDKGLSMGLRGDGSFPATRSTAMERFSIPR